MVRRGPRLATFLVCALALLLSGAARGPRGRTLSDWLEPRVPSSRFEAPGEARGGLGRPDAGAPPSATGPRVAPRGEAPRASGAPREPSGAAAAPAERERRRDEPPAGETPPERPSPSASEPKGPRGSGPGAGEESDRASDDSPAPGTPREEPPGEERATVPVERRPHVLLPEPGSYRAPALLRLAGELSGLPIVVQNDGLNEVEVEVPRFLAKRHVDLAMLELFLASQHLYLVEHHHPKRGRILVATSDPAWSPEQATYKETLVVDPRTFPRVADLVREEVDRRNARLPRGRPRYVAVPVHRVGKIFLWGPSPDGLREIAAAAESFEPLEDEDRARVYSHRGRYRKSEDLVDPLLERLTEGERERLRVSASGWGNILLYRARPEIAEKVEGILEEIDRPGPTPRPVWEAWADDDDPPTRPAPEEPLPPEAAAVRR